MIDGNEMALKALGIKSGVTYTVVKVGCTQEDCMYHADCQDNAIGLTDEDKGMFMICHDYRTSRLIANQKKKVYWKRLP